MKLDAIKRIGLITVIAVLAVGLIATSPSVANENQIYDETPTEEELKEKTAYLHNETFEEDAMTMNTTIGEERYMTDWTYAEVRHDWYLDPPFAGDFRLEGEITIYTWIDISDVEGHTNVLDLHMYLYEDDSDEHFAHGYEEYDEARTVFNEYSVSTDIEGHNISAGSRLRVEFVIEASENYRKRLAFGDSEFPSRLEISTPTYIDTETLTPRDSDYEERYTFPIDPEDEDTIIHFNTSITDPFGGYDVKGVYLTVENSEETIFYREDMLLMEGNDTSYRLNYTYTWDYTGVPEGEYNVRVSAVDNTGYNYRYPDNPGDETYGGHLQSLEETIWIGAEWYSVNLRTIDSLNETIERAEVQVLRTLEDKIVVDTEGLTDDEGITNLSMRGGENLVRVQWQDVVVFNETVDVFEDVPREEPLNLSCEVYTPTYRVVDVANEPIENVNLHIAHPNGTTLRRITRNNGEVEAPQLPAGEYSVRSEWLTKVVNETTHGLTYNEMVEIEASVHYLEMQVHDEREKPVSDVHLTFRYDDTERVANAAITDMNGNATLRLPGTSDFTYDIESRWRGVSVGTFENKELTESRTEELPLEIYYIDIQAVDSVQDSHEGLNEAELRVYNEQIGSLANTADLDSNGKGEIRLPSGAHDLEIYWRGVEVSPPESIIDVQEDTEEEVIECKVYEVEFTFVDERGEPLEHARVSIEHLEGIDMLVEEITDSDGEMKERMPIEEWQINVKWYSTETYSGTFTVSEDEDSWDLEIQTDVRYLTITTTDKDGEEISDVHITVSKEDRIWSGYTEDGQITFRLPEDTYEIEGEFQSTYMLTHVDVNETAFITISEEPEETLTFQDYPIPFYRTNLFMFIGILIVIIAAIFYVYIRESGITIDEEDESGYIEEPLEDELSEEKEEDFLE